jgi:hypothetical protein
MREDEQNPDQTEHQGFEESELLEQDMDPRPRPNGRLSLLRGQNEQEQDIDFDYFVQRFNTDPRKLYNQILRTILVRDVAERQVQGLMTERDDLKQERDQYREELFIALRRASASPVHMHQTLDRTKSAKLPDPLIFIGIRDKDDDKHSTTIDLDDWLAKTRRKLSANADHYTTTELQMGYVQNLVGGTAAKHLAPRLRPDSLNPFQNAEDMLKALERAFGNPHKKQDAQEAFRKLYQNATPFHEFWAEFQRLATEMEIPEATQLTELEYRINADLQQALASVLDITTVYDMADRCQVIDKKLQRAKQARNRTKGGTSGAGIGGTSGIRTEAGPLIKTEDDTPRPRSRSPKPQYSNPDKQRLSDEGKCFICHETGHIAADCPRKANKATGSISQIATTLEPKPQKHVMISTLEKQAAEVLDPESDDSDQVYSYNWKKKLEKKGT